MADKGTSTRALQSITSVAASGPAGGDLSGTYPNPLLKSLTLTLIFWVDGGVALTGDGSFNRPFKTIQEAINAATPSDPVRYAVYVAPGTYVEQVTLKPFITFQASSDTVIINYDLGDTVTAPTSMAGFGCELVNIDIVNNGTGNALKVQTSGSVALLGGVCQANDSEGALVVGSGFLLANNACGFFSNLKSGCKIQDTGFGVLTGCIFYTGNPGLYWDLEAGAGTLVKLDANNDFQNAAVQILGTQINITGSDYIEYDFTGTSLTSDNVQDAITELDTQARQLPLVFNVNAVNTTVSASFVTVGQLIYPGSNNCIISQFKAMIARTVGIGTVAWQIIDVSNGNAVIASGSGITANYPNIVTTTSFSNLSATEAVWEMQIKVSIVTVNTGAFYGGAIS